jgi:hypothetical protein
MLKMRQGIATAGPDGQSGWYDMGERLAIAAQSLASGSPFEKIVGIVHPVNTIAGGLANADIPPPGTAVQGLYGSVAVFLSALTAQATLSLEVNVYRGGVLLGGTGAFGWLSSGAGTPAFTAKVPLALPAITANTALVTSPSGVKWLPLQPLDVITVLLSLASGGPLTVPEGAVTNMRS